MSFFQRIGNAVSRFMYGRNGFDQLSLCTMWIAIILDLISSLFKGNIISVIFSVISTVLIVVTVFRIFSRNLYQRRKENQQYLEKFWWPLRRRFCNRKQRTHDKDHKYFTCPACQTVCRVPKGKGTIIITCPKCGTSIKGKS